jgi:subtilisin family serine protease/tetratricopeptide (TPR) repeat protein
MATACVIHAHADTEFVKRHVLRALPSNGYDCWLAGGHTTEGAVEPCQVILIVLSPALLRSAMATREIELALASQRTLIVVQIAALGEQEAARVPARLWALPRVDYALEGGEEAERLLTALLPPVDGRPETAMPKGAERIAWDEAIFSAELARATDWHDHARAEALVAALAGHLAHRQDAYPPKSAYGDLDNLRREREFKLMLRYAEAAIASGTQADGVRRLYGQALIETGQYDRALQVLESIVDDPDASKTEFFEACGLIGRTFKQRYVDAPDTPDAAAWIHEAITAYETAYLKDRSNFWHGVNAASCLIRAARDGVPGASVERAEEIARQIVDDLDQRLRKGPLPVWDCASRVEALLALDEYDEAERALDVYINHPGMKAFEVSSTFRQFDQVLQLGRTSRGAAILERLRAAMERYRAGTVAARPAAPSLAMEFAGESVASRPLLIRVGDRAWEPRDVTDLVIQSRLGKIVTARGSEASVRELLADSAVIAVEESRPGGQDECVRSIPFINAVAQGASTPGVYDETGDRALIAVIDDGIDVLHEAFLDADGNSRIVAIWDQRASGGTPPRGFSYGTFHDAAAIAGYVKTGTVPPALGRNPKGHGTHVASIAGGRAAGPFAGGVAPNAKLVIVVSAASGPIGYSQSHVEALAFIDAVATELDLPVVVNVSQGMNAGAHDGKSALEVAFDEFSESGRRQGRVVVKSAGNERAKGGHARVTLKSGALERLRWKRELKAAGTERIELWWSSADEIEFRLGEVVAPVDECLAEPDLPTTWSNWVGTAAPELEDTLPLGGPFRLSFTKRHVDNGDSLLLIELGNATAPAASGEWVLELHGTEICEGGEVHAWIERTARKPTWFRSHRDENMTLSVPATAQSVIAVGAVDACKPIPVGAFSSYGPSRDGQKKPLVCAPGVQVHAAWGGTAQDAYPQSGTSMAAPHVAGAIALVLSRTAKKGMIPSGNQIASALRQKTQNYDGSWDRGQGYGVIDVAALLAAFD